jgi:putative membrane-bound dehydrogenase-like protein
VLPLTLFGAVCCWGPAAGAAALQVLFLGDSGPHRPRERFEQLRPVLAARGIDLAYTQDLRDLRLQRLSRFAAVLLYANIERVEHDQESDLLEYVRRGGGFVPVHCASYCFHNSPSLIALTGAQFQRHGTGVVRTEIAAPDHPVMHGFGGFSSWDETYVHHRHNVEDREVLSYRVDHEGREPWTWVRTHGQGRVFYTAWGHDHRTWSHPGFHNLLERGIRWAAGDDPAEVPSYQADAAFPTPAMTALRSDLDPVEHVDVGAKIPNYTPGQSWGTQGQPLSQMQKPLPPSASLQHFVVPDGFRTELVAAEPQLGGKPIAMNWDHRGRLWVCETVDYPNQLQPSGRGRDRIRVCEDTDGDGQLDRFTVFAERLSIPTAITFAREGVIVQDGTRTLFLQDVDGDDRADVRHVLIDNWALGDTHGGVSNLRYGLDNWIWGMQGYNFSEPVIGGRRQPGFRMGFFRFRLNDQQPPEVAEIEFIRSTDNNTWGLGVSEEGLVFGSTANRNPSVYMPIANRYYERVRGWAPQQLGTIADTHLFRPITDRVRQVDHHGGYTAGAGHALYTARAYPRAWWNRTAFVCGPTGHLVGTFVLRREGADFHAHSPCNLLASDDEWSAPIAAEVGPDGHVWVLDWYNYIVQHNPTPQGFRTGRGNAYESDLRDKTHGRVYRVRHLEAAQRTEACASLAAAKPAELVRALQHPTMLWRLHAQRLLVERRQHDVVDALVKLLGDTSVDAIGLNVGVIHALWTLHGLDALDGSPDAWEAAAAALHHPSAGVRRNAVQVLAQQGPAVGPFVNRLLGREDAPCPHGLLWDTDPQVRLASLLALADIPAEEPAVGAALAAVALDTATMRDAWLRDALTSAAAMHADAFLAALRTDGPLPEQAPQVVRVVAEHVARGRPDAGRWQRLLAGMTQMPAALASAAARGLVDGWPADHGVRGTPDSDAHLATLLELLPAGGKAHVVRLARLSGSRRFQQHAERVRDSLLEQVLADGLPDADRISAAGHLVSLLPDDAAVVERVLPLLSPQAAPELTRGLLRALAHSNAENLAPRLLEQLARLTPDLREVAIGILLERPRTTADLLAAIEAGMLTVADLKLDQRQALQRHPDRAIRSRAVGLLEVAGGLPSPDRQRVLEQLLPVTRRPGDVTAGKSVFSKQCAKCHYLRGEGERIGPDLTGMAVHPKAELLGHIIDPSRSVEGNYRQYTVVTASGRILSGMMAGESRTSIELVDNEARRHLIQRSDIDQFLASQKSVMPEGFEQLISPQGLADVLEYLTVKERFVPLPLDKVATAVSTRGLFHSGNDGPDRLVFPDWQPKEVAGVPFHLVDPRGDTTPNIILLHGPRGSLPPRMPTTVSLPCNVPVRAVHLLGGISGWGYPAHQPQSVSMTVVLHYEDGRTEEHPLRNGVHLADYIRRVDVSESAFALRLGGRQVRYLAVRPQRTAPIREIEFRKEDDPTAPIIVAVTLETMAADSSAAAGPQERQP